LEHHHQSKSCLFLSFLKSPINNTNIKQNTTKQWFIKTRTTVDVGSFDERTNSLPNKSTNKRESLSS
jgi:hypothetical protein